MLDKFLNFINKQNLFNKEDCILLAVSGGIDSVAMCELFHLSGFNFAIAHCNFKLRKDESNDDEAFVKSLAKKYKVQFYCKHFETEKFAKDNGLSIQMAARELRYGWFYSLTKLYKYNHIAVAHHIDDEIETFFINLIRGTGIAGLNGISVVNNKVIRPLLFTGRNEIEDFVKQNKLKFREDSSNKSTKYIRNKIRQKIVPILKEINPDFENTFKENADILKDVELIYKKTIEKKKHKIFKQVDENIVVSIDKLKKLNPLRTYLFEFLSEFGFNKNNIDDIIENIDGLSGKQFISKTHRIIRNRNELVISKIKPTESVEFTINSKDKLLNYPIQMKISKLKNTNGFAISKDKSVALLDADKLEFPLVLRKWKTGDTFHPIGMKTKKKLSDFFINAKLSIIEKENVWILCSNNQIVWIVNHRIDNRFKITNETKNILKLELPKIK